MIVQPVQVPSLILPTSFVTGNETEHTHDLLEHTSLEFDVRHLEYKTIHITAQEINPTPAAGNLWVWVELSPVLTTTSANHWAAIGGGGGALAPVAPLILVPTGVTGTITTAMLAWTMHSVYARVVIQMVAGATPLIDFWSVQLYVCGKAF